MPNIHYIASAGTGKTYQLIEEVIKKIKDENLSLEDLLILTFTEKASQELKERITKRLKEELKKTTKKEEKIRFHRELFLNNSNIGTFHSIFLKILKKYPKESQIDSSFQVLSENLDTFLEKTFEQWIEKDFQENRQIWEEITDIYTYSQIKRNIFTLYKNRLKIKKTEIKLEKEEIKKTAEDLKQVLNTFIEENRFILEEIKNKYKDKLFRNSPFEIQHILKEKRYIDLPTDKEKKVKVFGRKSFIFKTSKDPKAEEYLKKHINFKKIKKLDQEIGYLTKKLKIQSLDYNAKLLLDRFFSFLDFVEEIKKEEKKIDFNDILEKTLKLLENKQITEEIKKKFRYIFVDEFQDTDGYQIKILEKIMDNNIYIFGDPKQCIYTWRDADLDAYMTFVEKYPFETKTLSQNYRSSSVLMDFYNHIFTNNTLLSHIQKKYREPIKTQNSQEGYIKLIKIKNKEKTTIKEIIKQEALCSVNLVKELLQEGNSLEDIMFLFRKNEDLNTFLKIFQKYNIPVNTQSTENLFQQEEIKQIINILKFIEFPEDRLLFLKLLKSPLFYISDKELEKYKHNFSIDTPEADVIKNLIQKKYDLTPYQILDEILQKTSLLEAYALEKDSKQKLANVEHFKNIAQKLSTEGYSLRDFIIYTEETFIETPIIEDQNSIRFLTIHKAKGLESKIVVIPLISLRPDNAKLNEVHIHKNKVVLNLRKAKSASLEEIEALLKNQIKNEEERLFYVAVTRAKEKLIFIESETSKNQKESYKNLLNKALKDKNLIQIQKISLKDINPEIKIKTSAEKNKKNILEKLKEIELLEEKLQEKYNKAFKTKKFTSVSQLMEENKEEIQYKSADQKVSIYIGILVHEVLEKIDIKEFSYEKAKKILLERENLIPADIREKVKEESLKILKIFEASEIFEELKNANVLIKEMPFTLKEEDFFIEGRIDIIYEKDGNIVVMDYKTNRYETEEELEKIKNIYRVQKEYYHKAVQRIFPKKNVVFKLGLLQEGKSIEI